MDVVDEIIDFFAAAAETTQAATTTILSQMIKNPEMLDYVRSEFDDFLHMKQEKDENLKDLPKLEVLDEIIDYGINDRLIYLGQVANEALRF